MDHISITPHERPLLSRVEYRIATRRGDCIGTIEWYGEWNKWCFFPATETVWDEGCLEIVHDYLMRLPPKE